MACTPLVGTRAPVLDGAVVVNYKDDPQHVKKVRRGIRQLQKQRGVM